MAEKTPWPWWELVETMWNSQEGKTLWMSSVLEPHKVTSVLSNLVPMVTNTLCSSSNVKIMSKQVYYVRSTNIARQNVSDLKKKKKNIVQTVKFLTLTEQTVPADTDMDDEAQCVIWIANLIHCDSESHSKVYFGKEDCWGTVCLCVSGISNPHDQNLGEPVYLVFATPYRIGIWWCGWQCRKKYN